MHKLIRDLKGARFGAWTVKEYVEGKMPPHWVCDCDCGSIRVVSGHSLKKGASTNCGCLRQHAQTHGFATRKGRTRTYRQWKAMRSRCRPNAADKENYIKRGISVCERWNDFSAFLSDMGESPEGMSLDRIDNDAGYSAENCRWADFRTQRRNQRRVTWVDYCGEVMTVQDAAGKIGVHPAAIWNDKRRNGGTAQEALDRVASRR